eukprot:506721-Alexandrium_andersonii.AAC.1
MGVSDVCRFRAAEGAVWPVGRAGTAAPSGWILDPELTLTRGLRDRICAPAYDLQVHRKSGFFESRLVQTLAKQ